ncbi:MAG: hypothetical protein JHD16_13355 [Solirubrobacteraceae bacterium]|nr:hypothetical protein [Solirubrobacteraceae bacterium]
MLADRFGPRAFMGGGPVLAAVGLMLLARLGADAAYVRDLLPGLLIFAAGLALTVAPLSATVLADADEHNAGIASATNNAVARVAGLVAIAGLGAMVASSFSGAIDRQLAGRDLSPAGQRAVEQAKSRTMAQADTTGLAAPEAREVARAVEAASVDAFQRGMWVAAGLVGLGGVIGLVGIRNPRREVLAQDCAGGALAGAPKDVAECDQSADVLPLQPVPTGAAA